MFGYRLRPDVLALLISVATALCLNWDMMTQWQLGVYLPRSVGAT